MKRIALSVGLFLSLASLMAFSSAQPKPRLDVSVRAVAGVVWVKWFVTAGGAPDSVTTATVQAIPTVTVNRKYLTSTIVDSVSFPRPSFGGTISGRVDAESFRRALHSTIATRNWTYTEPVDTAPPQPTIDSVKVIPASATLQPGGTVLLTARTFSS